jgi:hypothetical protein
MEIAVASNRTLTGWTLNVWEVFLWVNSNNRLTYPVTWASTWAFDLCLTCSVYKITFMNDLFSCPTAPAICDLLQ